MEAYKTAKVVYERGGKQDYTPVGRAYDAARDAYDALDTAKELERKDAAQLNPQVSLGVRQEQRDKYAWEYINGLKNPQKKAYAKKCLKALQEGQHMPDVPRSECSVMVQQAVRQNLEGLWR